MKHVFFENKKFFFLIYQYLIQARNSVTRILINFTIIEFSNN